MKKNLLILFTLLLLSQVDLVSQNAHQLPQELLDEIEARIEGGHYTGLEIGILDSTGMHFYGFGKRSLKDASAPDEHTFFEIGSISKVFTGILLADRVVEGKMKLDDPIESYLPEEVQVPAWEDQKILLRQLSTHTSSLPRMPSNFSPADPMNPFADYSAEDLYEFLSGYELTREIGSQAEYSNLAVGLLGHIMALESGKTYEALLQERICAALQLQDTRLRLTEEDKVRLAQPTSQGLANASWDFDCLAACGGIHSTAADMLRFLAAQIKPEGPLAEAMLLSQQPHGEQKLGNAGLGLGWLLVERDGKKAIIHDGATGGFRAFAGCIPADKYAFIILSNATTNVNDLGAFLLGSTHALRKMEPGILSIIRREIDQKGVKKGMKLYKKLQKDKEKNYFLSAAKLNQIGTYYVQVEAYEQAFEIFEQCQALYPRDAHCLFALGELSEKRNQKVQAETFYRLCLDLNPTHEAALQKLKELED